MWNSHPISNGSLREPWARVEVEKDCLMCVCQFQHSRGEAKLPWVDYVSVL